MRVLVIGLTRELPLSAADAMDIADSLVARAASVHTEGEWARVEVCLSDVLEIKETDCCNENLHVVA